MLSAGPAAARSTGLHRGPRRLLRRAAVFAWASVLLLAGCGSGELTDGHATPAASAGSSSQAENSAGTSAGTAAGSSAGSSAADDALAAGLLAAADFGPGTTVTAITSEELQQGADAAVAAAADTVVTPASCAAAVNTTRTEPQDYSALAAQVAQSGTTSVVQLLTEGGDVGQAIGRLAAAADSCPQATVTSPALGTVTIAFAPLDVPDLGDGSAAVSYDTTLTQPDGSTVTVPALLGEVRDGDRLISLISTDAGGGPLDTAAFADLQRRAFQFQADALD